MVVTGTERRWYWQRRETLHREIHLYDARTDALSIILKADATVTESNEGQLQEPPGEG